MKPDGDFGGAVAEFIPFLDSRINKIIADEGDADESQPRKNDPDRDKKDRA
jgi:hypothetical protein